ncbi:polymerase [Spirochaetia bacterium]|nr:polymerase [Spirochaetia bacterium]
MIDFAQLQELIRIQLAEDRAIRMVDASGTSLEAAVTEAATLLNLPVRRIEYEILERGFPGFLGMGKKEWAIRAYQHNVLKQSISELIESKEEAEAEAEEVIADKDGAVYVHLSIDGVLLKVVPPVGNGKMASEADAMLALRSRNVTDIDKEAVRAAVKDAEGVYTHVGNFDHKFTDDSMISVNIAEDEMKAFISLTLPGTRGCDQTVDALITFLKNKKIVYGIREKFLVDFMDQPIYREQVLVAEGLLPQNGKNAQMEYFFQTDQSKVRLQEGRGGQIDFKQLNIIHNVIENQPLAKRIHATDGITGRTVTGKYLPAKDGNEMDLPLGKNTHADKDGDTILSDIHGQVVLVGGKVNVEPVYTVPGNVNLKTGNIVFLGTVVVQGSVEDGFSVKAAGNIEVNGTVERANLEAEGDIIVHQGIVGKGVGSVKAGKSLWARFIENCNVETGDMVIVSDGIINSKIDANKRIICQGKRAHIVGGRLRASEEISALLIGSSTGGTETICEVGIDPKSKSQLEALIDNKASMQKETEEIQLNIQTLVNIKKQRKSLPEDKEQVLIELVGRRKELLIDIQKTDEQIVVIQEFLANLKARGKVSAGNKVFPGVKIVIRDITEQIRNEYKAVTFTLENGLVRSGKYEEPDEESKKQPEGYME